MAGVYHRVVPVVVPKMRCAGDVDAGEWSEYAPSCLGRRAVGCEFFAAVAVLAVLLPRGQHSAGFGAAEVLGGRGSEHAGAHAVHNLPHELETLSRRYGGGEAEVVRQPNDTLYLALVEVAYAVDARSAVEDARRGVRVTVQHGPLLLYAQRRSSSHHISACAPW
jgi:hypothetical protein